MSATGLLITNAGATAIAADLSGGADLVLSHVAFGDAGGVPYNPVAAQTALVNERYRAPIVAVAVVDGAIVIDAILPADTNDASARPSHGFSVAECGLYNSGGTLIGVARLGNGFKPAPSSGQAVTATYRLKLAVANPSAITIAIDLTAAVPFNRHLRHPWIAVESDSVTAPPGAPALGDSYVIPAGATGAWSGFTGRIAQWVGVWALSDVASGTVVQVNSRALSDFSRFLRKTSSTGWSALQATPTQFGFTRTASLEEARAGIRDDVALTPLGMSRRIGAPMSVIQFPEILTSTKSISLTPATVAGQGGTISVVAGWRIMIAAPFADDPTLGSYREYLTPAWTTPVLAINSTYYLRANVQADALVIYVQQGADNDATPGTNRGTANAVTGGGFDSTREDILLAKITTGAAGTSPQAIAYVNAALLDYSVYRQSPAFGQFATPATSTEVYNNGSGDTVTLYAAASVIAVQRHTLNWGRKPSQRFLTGGYVWIGSATQTQYASALGANYVIASNRHYVDARIDGDWVEANAFSGGQLCWLSWWLGGTMTARA